MIKNGIAHGTHSEVLNLIKTLSHKYGYCWADNRDLAKKLDLSISRVSHIISDLYDANLVEREITYAQGMKWVDKRLLRPVLSRDARGTAGNDQKQNKSAININNNAPEKVKATQFAAKLGINIFVVTGMISKFGAKYVIEKLHIVANSLSVKNRVGLFIAACTNNYKSKKAEKAEKYTVPYRQSAHIATVCTENEIKASPIEKSTFLKDFVASHKTGAVTERFGHLFA